MINFPTFLTGIIIYIVGTASPGPANLSIANAAMNYGRKAGLILAAGVISGSLCWGLLTGIGISALLASSPHFIAGIKIVGACYLCWLGYKAIVRAMANKASTAGKPAARPLSSMGFYLQGLGIHLTNPKAVLTWFTVTSISLGATATKGSIFTLIGCCAAMGMLIFSLYAVAFSARSAEALFIRSRRAFDLVCAACYLLIAAGFMMTLR